MGKYQVSKHLGGVEKLVNIGLSNFIKRIKISKTLLKEKPFCGS